MNFVEKFLNEGLAWISTIIGVFLSCKYLIRKYLQLNTPYKTDLIKLNKYAKKYHIHLGILLVILGLVHGLFSSFNVISFNMGTICWIISVLLGINWFIRKKLNSPGLWIKYHRFLTIIFLLTLFLHLTEVNLMNFDFDKFSSDNSISTDDIISGDLSKYNFKDGVYEGIANGFGPNLTLEVTIHNNILIDISVISHNEKNERYYGPPMNIIPKEIIDKQNTDVDTISGATLTSNGIIKAVKDALSKATLK